MKSQNPLHNIKDTLNQYKHSWILSYFIVYLIWFNWLEKNVTTNFYPMYHRLDDFIPFNELFIIPYFLWFLYIAVTILFFFFTSKSDYYKCCSYLFIGMTICLTIYTLWPNGHTLRVNLNTLGRDNIFIEMVRKIYSIDTPTNVSPSIHVFNSVGAFIAIYKSERLRPIKWLQISTFILTVLICMSTVFLKQHSVVDVFCALVLNLILYFVVYSPLRQRQEDDETVPRTL